MGILTRILAYATIPVVFLGLLGLLLGAGSSSRVTDPRSGKEYGSPYGSHEAWSRGEVARQMREMRGE